MFVPAAALLMSPCVDMQATGESYDTNRDSDPFFKREVVRGIIRGFLGEAADAPARRDGDAAGFGRQLAADGAKQRRFTDPVAADKTNPGAGDDLRGALIDQQPSGEADRDIGDGKHAALSPKRRVKASRLSTTGSGEKA